MRNATRVFLVLAAAMMISYTGASGKPLDQLVQWADQDALPEVREAAALAVIPALVASEQSDEELRQLALMAASAELKSAAARALGLRWVQVAESLDQLETLAASGEFSEVREAAGEALAQRLLQSHLFLDALASLALTGESPELRGAALPALTIALTQSEHSIEDLLSLAHSGATAEYRLASAQALVLRLESSPFFALNSQALIEIVGGQGVTLPEEAQGANAQLRQAAGAGFQDLLAQVNWSLTALKELAGNTKSSPELRAAAGAVLSQQLLQANLSLEDLTEIATGKTPELRKAAESALIQSLVGAIGRGELSIAMLVSSVASATSEELAEAEAEAAFVLLRSTLVAPQTQSQIEEIANGQPVQIRSLTIDGSLKAFRVTASNFLAGIYTFYGFLNRLSDPLGELTAIAKNPSFTEEYRAAAARALAQVYQAQRGRASKDLATLSALLNQMKQETLQGRISQALETLSRLQSILDAERSLLIVTAEVGGEFTTSQLLNHTVNEQISEIEQSVKTGDFPSMLSSINTIQRALDTIERGIARAPDVDTSTLEQIAVQGATPEVRQAAGQALSQRFLGDSPGVGRLQQLAEDGASLELRQAAISALAATWVSNGADPEMLYRTALEGTTDEVRLAAAQALLSSSLMRDLPLAKLQAMSNGETIEIGDLSMNGEETALRQAFASALQAELITHREPEETLQVWAVQGTTPELRQAASGALARAYATPDGATIDRLIQLSATGASEELRIGVAQALRERLIASTLTESDLFALAAQHTLAFGSITNTSAALSQALAQALADRLAQDS